MILLPLILVMIVVGIVYAATSRRRQVVGVGGGAGTKIHPARQLSGAGRASVAILVAAVVMWALTSTVWPIYYVAAVGGVAFILAVFAVAIRHDRSPLLLLPLVAVPLAVAASLAFVLLQ